MFLTKKRNNKYLLLLKADEFLRDRAIVAALRSYDGMIVGMNVDPTNNPHRFFDHVIKADPHDADIALNAVKELEISEGLTPEFVVPITEMTLKSSFMIASAYKLPSLSAMTIDAARNKNIMKKCFYEANVTTPKHRVFSNLLELRNITAVMHWPVIIKPVNAAHSVGIIRVDSEKELEKSYQYCSDGLESVSKSWGIEHGMFQVEEYIDADKEISVEIFNQGDEHRVIAITDKSLTPPPFFAETGHMIPSLESNNQKVIELAKNACKALGITMGISHVEIRIDRSGVPYVIEVAARPGGDGIMDLVERSCAINPYELHIKSYMGMKQNLPGEIKVLGTAAIAFMQISRGTISGIHIPGKLSKEFMSVYISAKIGDALDESLNYDDRLGTVELFWKNDTSPNLSGVHVQRAKDIAGEIYDIEV